MAKRHPPLVPGDLIGVAAPAAAFDGAALDRGIAEIESLGFRVRVEESVREHHLFTAGTVERRLSDLRSLLADPDVRAIFCARGGAGSPWVLEALGLDFLREHAKPFVGCSDITWFHLAFDAARIVSVHGPVVTGDLARGSYDRESLLHALCGAGSPYSSPAGELHALRAGSCEGVLRGGCLSIVASASGTRWGLRGVGEGTLLFLEDVAEPPYRIDRLVFQLRAAGAFEGVRGIVFGEMKGCRIQGQDYDLEEVLLEALRGFVGPVAIGLPSGHTSGASVSLPLGVRARLTCDTKVEFEVLEGATE